MERVTQKDERGYYLVGDGIYSDWGVPEKFRGDDVDRLAAYEDTGLEPEEIAKIREDVENGYLKSTARRYGVSPDRLRELAQADREGISPCTFCRFNPPSSSDGKPCCMCPAQAALRREQE